MDKSEVSRDKIYCYFNTKAILDSTLKYKYGHSEIENKIEVLHKNNNKQFYNDQKDNS
ncbi:hypothetical protein FBALC1_06628 [Flavobacteriales bacterium ALC-1]|nr:hypothetical protein FBALC1_06628 [Flavobacteriales bacterium ALC-1]